MYSLMPAVVSALFLGYGVYVVAVKGWTRVTGAFLWMCLTTFVWQGSWAVLFQVRDPALALFLVKFGYLLIIFLPTAYYHFLVELTQWPGERRYVLCSYFFAAGLAAVNLFSDRFVAGYYEYFWGYYPKAGPLHPLHVLQTALVASRGLYITYLSQRAAVPDEQIRLRLLLASWLVYVLAAVDYLCNYGFEFYPPGGVFTVIALGLIIVATRSRLMSPVALAASVAHEMRTPLATIRMQAGALGRHLPELLRGYRLAVEHGLLAPRLPAAALHEIDILSQRITHQVDRSGAFIDMMLAAARAEKIDRTRFAACSARACVEEALARYPFMTGERQRVALQGEADFVFWGSRELLVLLLFNLLKNALYALAAADKGEIVIGLSTDAGNNSVQVTDTGSGMPEHVRLRVFDEFFSTKGGKGTGIGLAFCRRVMIAFGGQIRCESEEGRYTRFTLEFPPFDRGATPARQSAQPLPRSM
jgi:two-component system CAI-1 autoinducer sensor kinase/phosphatase CqsS